MTAALKRGYEWETPTNRSSRSEEALAKFLTTDGHRWTPIFFDANCADSRGFNFYSREFVKMAHRVHAIKAPEDWSTPRRCAL